MTHHDCSQAVRGTVSIEGIGATTGAEPKLTPQRAMQLLKDHPEILSVGF